MERQEKLESAVMAIDNVCKKMLQKQDYQQEMQICVQAVNDSCIMLFQENPNARDILSILEDMMYGMTQNDEVFLLDVLRFGLKVRLEQEYSELEKIELESIYE